MSTCADVGSFTGYKSSVVQASSVGFTSEVSDYLVVLTGPYLRNVLNRIKSGVACFILFVCSLVLVLVDLHDGAVVGTSALSVEGQGSDPGKPCN